MRGVKGPDYLLVTRGVIKDAASITKIDLLFHLNFFHMAAPILFALLFILVIYSWIVLQAPISPLAILLPLFYIIPTVLFNKAAAKEKESLKSYFQANLKTYPEY